MYTITSTTAYQQHPNSLPMHCNSCVNLTLLDHLTRPVRCTSPAGKHKNVNWVALKACVCMYACGDCLQGLNFSAGRLKRLEVRRCSALNLYHADSPCADLARACAPEVQESSTCSQLRSAQAEINVRRCATSRESAVSAVDRPSTPH